MGDVSKIIPISFLFVLLNSCVTELCKFKSDKQSCGWRKEADTQEAA
jgi:hypothetical protein